MMVFIRLLIFNIFVFSSYSFSMYDVLIPSRDLIDYKKTVKVRFSLNTAKISSSTDEYISDIEEGNDEEIINRHISLQETLINQVHKNDEFTLMHYYAQEGDIYCLYYLIEAKPKLMNKCTIEGMTPLHYACLKGHTECVKKLVEAGAILGRYDIDGKEELYYAAMSGVVETVAYLLKLNSDIYNIDKKTDINYFTTPLHIAAQEGHFEMVNFLISHGAHVNHRRSDGKTPLDLVSKKNKELSMLLKFNYAYHGAYLLKRSYINKLEKFVQEDQQLRCTILKYPQEEREKMRVDLNIDEINKKHCAFIQKIIKQYGWPKLSEFDEQTCQKVWLLVQHADYDVAFQEYCLKLMRNLEDHEIDKTFIAYLYDRIQINRNKKQKYGTQLDHEFKPLALVNSYLVDVYRSLMHLEPLDEYIQRCIELQQRIVNTH